MKNLYLAAAIIGAVIPYLFFFQHIGSAGLSLPAFVAAVFANSAASGFTADLLISSFVWLVMVVFYTWQKQLKVATSLNCQKNTALPIFTRL